MATPLTESQILTTFYQAQGLFAGAESNIRQAQSMMTSIEPLLVRLSTGHTTRASSGGGGNNAPKSNVPLTPQQIAHRKKLSIAMRKANARKRAAEAAAAGGAVAPPPAQTKKALTKQAGAGG